MASAAAAYAAQQAAAAATTGASCPPAPLPAGVSTYPGPGHTVGYTPPTAEAQNIVPVAAAPSAGQFVQVMCFGASETAAALLV